MQVSLLYYDIFLAKSTMNFLGKDKIMECSQANPIVHYIYFLYFYERIKESHSLCRQVFFCEYYFTPAEISYC